MIKCTPIVLLCLVACSPPVSAGDPPASVIDLNAWKLTLPYDTERSGNPDEVVQPELAGFHDPTCFYVSESKDAVVFRASCDGQETINSKYPRSELREMELGRDDEASWATGDKTPHVLEVECAITQVPKRKRHVVCAQIHDADDDVLMIRLEDRELFIEREGADEIELDSDYELGDRFTIRIVAANERIRVWHNDELKMDWKVSKRACYFKVGCYTQSNREIEKRTGSYGEVVINRLVLDHQE